MDTAVSRHSLSIHSFNIYIGNTDISVFSNIRMRKLIP